MEQRNIISKSFYNSIQGIFITTIEIFIFHSCLTWLIFDIFGIDFVFLLSLIAGILSLIPIISPWIILIPANFIYLFLNEWNIFSLFVLDIIYFIVISFVDNEIYTKNLKNSSPYITGLSFVMGVYTFGIKGLIYGPVLLCFSITAIDIIRIIIK